MKKISLIFPLLLAVLASCSLGSTANNFSALSTAHIESQIDTIYSIRSLIGLDQHMSAEGQFHGDVSLAEMMSGTFSTTYNSLADGLNSELILHNPMLAFQSMVSSGSAQADMIDLRNIANTSYVQYKNLTGSNIFTPDIAAVFTKYAGTWLKSEQATASGEDATYRVMANISKLSKNDLKKYAVDYPIWTENADLGMSGSLHTYSVTLNQQNLIALIDRLSLDLSGSGLTDTDKQSMTKKLAELSFSGTLGFDPNDAKASQMMMAISQSGALLANVASSTEKHGGMLTFTSPAQNADISISYHDRDDKNTLDLVAHQDGTEIGRLSAYILHDGHDFRELSIEGSVQGVTASFRHTMVPGGFVGKMVLPVGTLDYSGSLDGKKLTGLTLNGTTPMGNLTMDLTASGSDDMIRGPLVLKVQGESAFTANVALQVVGSEKLGLILDILGTTPGAPQYHIGMFNTLHMSRSDAHVEMPQGAQDIKNMLQELDQLSGASPDGFSEGESTLSGSTFPSDISGSVSL